MDRLLVIVFWPMKKMTEKANKLGGIGLKLIYEFLPKKLIFFRLYHDYISLYEEWDFFYVSLWTYIIDSSCVLAAD